MLALIHRQVTLSVIFNDALVGGMFQSTPLCETADQIGCLVTYSSWRDREPPDEDVRFANTGDASTVAACVNPVALAGGKATLEPY